MTCGCSPARGSRPLGSERRESNPPEPAWQVGAAPCGFTRSKVRGCPTNRQTIVRAAGVEPAFSRFQAGHDNHFATPCSNPLVDSWEISTICFARCRKQSRHKLVCRPGSGRRASRTPFPCGDHSVSNRRSCRHEIIFQRADAVGIESSPLRGFLLSRQAWCLCHRRIHACLGQESNLHGVTRSALNRVRLPIRHPGDQALQLKMRAGGGWSTRRSTLHRAALHACPPSCSRKDLHLQPPG